MQIIKTRTRRQNRSQIFFRDPKPTVGVFEALFSNVETMVNCNKLAGATSRTRLPFTQLIVTAITPASYVPQDMTLKPS